MATVDTEFDADADLGVCSHYNLCVVDILFVRSITALDTEASATL
jgi:hypothetical protein